MSHTRKRGGKWKPLLRKLLKIHYHVANASEKPARGNGQRA